MTIESDMLWRTCCIWRLHELGCDTCWWEL